MLGLAACGGSGSIGDGDDAAVHLRAVNLIPDSPTIQFSVDGTGVFSASFPGATSFNAAHAGTSTLKLGAQNAPDLTGAAAAFTDIGTPLQQVFTENRDYTLFAFGPVAAPEMVVIEGTDERSAVADNKVIWQIVHTAPAAGSLDVYLTAPEAGVATPTFIGNINLRQLTTAPVLTLTSTATETLSVNMTIELRQPGTGTVLYTSRPIAVNEQNRVLFGIADAQGPGPRTVELIALPGTAATSGSRQVDAADNAEVRFTHVSVDAPALDLLRGSNVPVASNIAFGAASPYVPVASGALATVGVPTGTTSGFLFVNNLSATAGLSYTLYTIGPVSDISAQVFVDDRRPIAGQTQFRFVHAASSLSDDAAINIYLTRPGAGLTLTGSTPASPSVSSLGYRGLSGYQSLKAGSYDAYVARVGATTTVLGPVVLQLNAREALTFVLADTPGAGALTLAPFVDSRP